MYREKNSYYIYKSRKFRINKKIQKIDISEICIYERVRERHSAFIFNKRI